MEGFLKSSFFTFNATNYDTQPTASSFTLICGPPSSTKA